MSQHTYKAQKAVLLTEYPLMVPGEAHPFLWVSPSAGGGH